MENRFSLLRKYKTFLSQFKNHNLWTLEKIMDECIAKELLREVEWGFFEMLGYWNQSSFGVIVKKEIALVNATLKNKREYDAIDILDFFESLLEYLSSCVNWDVVTKVRRLRAERLDDIKKIVYGYFGYKDAEEIRAVIKKIDSINSK